MIFGLIQLTVIKNQLLKTSNINYFLLLKIKSSIMKDYAPKISSGYQAE